MTDTTPPDDEREVDCPHGGYDRAERGCPACEDIFFAAMACPERIWLQIEDDGEVIPKGTEGRTWCCDRINKSDVEYVRAAITAALAARSKTP